MTNTQFETQFFAVKDILPNQFRRIEKYELQQPKLDALDESMNKTGLWPVLLARVVQTKTGPKAEIPYGHHRLAIIKKRFKPTDKIAVHTFGFSDEDMLQIMARENMEEWGTSALVEVETIAATVQAYADGSIKLKEPADNRDVRYAPSFRRDSVRTSGQKPYTAQTVADFLGWLKPNGRAKDRVHSALNVLELIELGHLKETDLVGLNTSELEAVVEETNRRIRVAEFQAKQAEEAAERNRAAARKTQDQEERAQQEEFERRNRAAAQKHRDSGRERAGNVARDLTTKLRSGDIGRKQVRDEAYKMDPVKERPQRGINQAAFQYHGVINRILNEHSSETAALREFIEFRGEIDAGIKKGLIRELRMLQARIDKLITALDSAPEPPVKNARAASQRLLSR